MTSRTNFKLGLKSALYDFTSARDSYREATTNAGIGMHRDLVLRYIELQALVITPIAPHWAEHIWLDVLKKVCSYTLPLNFITQYTYLKQPETVQRALYPDVPEPSPTLSATLNYVRSTSSNITSAEASFVKRLNKGKTITFDPRKPKKLTIYAAKKYPAWQEKYIDLVREAFDATSISVNDKDLNGKVAKFGEMKKAMPFVQGLKRRLITVKETPETVFDRKLGFDELQVLGDMVDTLKKTTGCKAIEVISVEEGGKVGTVLGSGETKEGLPALAEGAIPGTPAFQFENIPDESN